MPWVPGYSESELRAAIADARAWTDVLERLGLRYHGKTIATARRWAERWEISTGHLSDLRGSVSERFRYTEEDLREAVAKSQSWAATLRELGYCTTGNNWKTLQRKCAELGISTAHFDPYAASRAAKRRGQIPLANVLVEHSTYSRASLKRRLFDEGLKPRICEECGQGETWRSGRIGLILDHVNGIRDDNRLANLRIVCPNCAAALDTHCGRKNRLPPRQADCEICDRPFEVRYSGHRFCSLQCGAKGRRNPQRGVPKPSRRKVERPPREQLAAEVEELGFSAVGRRYGVSDNAIRKWLAWYDREAA